MFNRNSNENNFWALDSCASPTHTTDHSFRIVAVARVQQMCVCVCASWALACIVPSFKICITVLCGHCISHILLGESSKGHKPPYKRSDNGSIKSYACRDATAPLPSRSSMLPTIDLWLPHSIWSLCKNTQFRIDFFAVCVCLQIWETGRLPICDKNAISLNGHTELSTMKKLCDAHKTYPERNPLKRTTSFALARTSRSVPGGIANEHN